MFDALRYGIVGRALKNNLVNINYWNIRDYGLGVHHKVDDKPYGGGPGMIMLYQPLVEAIRQAKLIMPLDVKVIYLSPQGVIISQNLIKQVVENSQPLLFISGRYEGIDERIIDKYVDEEWSLGNFVLSGGEFVAMSIIDSMIRLLPNSLGNQESSLQDSFVNGILDYPNYTKPVIIDDASVPQVLLSGDHDAIKCWRRKQALGKTWLKKPELLYNLELNALDKKLLNEFKYEYKCIRG